MYPDLSYVFHDLIGTEYDNWLAIFKTFGLLMALSFVLAGYFVYKELVRREQPGGPFHSAIKTVEKVVGVAPTWRDVLPNAVIGFILGFKLPHLRANFEAFKSEPVGQLFSLEGNFLIGILGALALGGFAYYDKYRQKLPKPKKVKVLVKPSDRVGDIIIIAAISGVVGAKLFAIFENINTIDFSQLLTGSGLAIYGGLIGGIIGVSIYIRILNLPLLHVMDAAAPSLILAMGTGRLGCHFSGDGDWGIVAAQQPDWWFLPDWLWSWDYPRNVSEGFTNENILTHPNPNVPEGVASTSGNITRAPIDCDGCKYSWKLGAKVYPTSIYEFVTYTATFGLLWAIRKKVTIPGMLFCLYLILYGIERWAIEKIRVNDIFMWGLTQAEFISLVFVSIGIFGLGILWARQR